MAVNKVIYDGEPLIDLTGDTVTADTLLEGATAHDASGAAITGAMKSYAVDDVPTMDSENLVKSGGVYSAIPRVVASDGIEVESYTSADGKPTYAVSTAGSLTLLWTNPNWNTNFAAQTVSLNLSGYTAIMTVFAYATSVKTRRGTQTQLVDGATYTFEAPHTSGGNYWFRREVTASTTGVTFGTGGYFENGSFQGGDLYTMPLYIYGIK